MSTLVLSLEAIVLSTFVMVVQNRQSAFQQAKTNHDFNEDDLEIKTTTELSRVVHQLTIDVHRHLLSIADMETKEQI